MRVFATIVYMYYNSIFIIFFSLKLYGTCECNLILSFSVSVLMYILLYFDLSTLIVMICHLKLVIVNSDYLMLFHIEMK